MARAAGKELMSEGSARAEKVEGNFKNQQLTADSGQWSTSEKRRLLCEIS